MVLLHCSTGIHELNDKGSLTIESATQIQKAVVEKLTFEPPPAIDETAEDYVPRVASVFPRIGSQTTPPRLTLTIKRKSKDWHMSRKTLTVMQSQTAQCARRETSMTRSRPDCERLLVLNDEFLNTSHKGRYGMVSEERPTWLKYVAGQTTDLVVCKIRSSNRSDALSCDLPCGEKCIGRNWLSQSKFQRRV